MSTPGDGETAPGHTQDTGAAATESEQAPVVITRVVVPAPKATHAPVTEAPDADTPTADTPTADAPTADSSATVTSSQAPSTPEPPTPTAPVPPTKAEATPIEPGEVASSSTPAPTPPASATTTPEPSTPEPGTPEPRTTGPRTTEPSTADVVAARPSRPTPRPVRANIQQPTNSQPTGKPAASKQSNGSRLGAPSRVGTVSRSERERRRWIQLVIAAVVVVLVGGGVAAAAVTLAGSEDSGAVGTNLGAVITAPTALRPSLTPSATPSPIDTGDAEHPGIAVNTKGLSPELRRRVNLAMAAARKAGVTLRINDGWRSLAEQQKLHRAAVKATGSEKEASKKVLPAQYSEHPRGRAVDMGPPTGAAWLDKFGAKYGLCRRYDNETWHFEPLIAPGGTCPARLKDGRYSIPSFTP